jgi:uncharacterized protein (TIGR03790 family)
LFVLALGGNKHAEAQSGLNVLIVQNDATSTGDTIGKRYIQRRSVPSDNVCRLMTTAEETISRPLYEQQIERPIWDCIAGKHAHDRILYIVLTKGIPLRIEGSGGRTGTVSSVDSELTLLYRRRSGQAAPVVGSVPNPYFAANAPASAVKPFTHEQQDIFLVTRLDGYTVEDALALVDRGAAPVRDGRFILDERSSWTDTANAWLRGAAEKLRGMGLGNRVVLEESSSVVTNETNVLGYYSWGSNDSAIRVRHFGFGFVPGALAALFVSTDARTFKEPPAAWTPSSVATQDSIFGGSHQSLIADLVRDGVTGAAGHVAEPYLDATVRPDVLFPAYASGMNLAEAFYAAMPYLSWQTVVLGDPLCAPFRQRTLSPGDIDKGIDSATELPAFFAGRRLARMPPGVKPDAAAAFVRAGVRLDAHDEAGARQAVEAAVAADPRFTTARLDLAIQDEAAGQFDRAIAHYRAILAYAPNELIALNNLAFALAVQKGAPQEALPLAERAVTLSPNAPVMLDTLAWIQHLLGRHGESAATIGRALARESNNADIRWHAAVIYEAVGDGPRARAELEAALKLKPALANGNDIKELRERLKPAGGRP